MDFTHVKAVLWCPGDGYMALHLVKEVKEGQFLIGNNIGKINGRVPAHVVKGRVVSVTD